MHRAISWLPQSAVGILSYQWAQNASSGVPGAAVAVLGDVVFFATSLVHCSSSALSTGLAFARTCRYCCEVDGLLTEGSKAAHALRVRLFTSTFSCRGKAHAVYALLSLWVKSFLWLNPSLVFNRPAAFWILCLRFNLSALGPDIALCGWLGSKHLPAN